MKVSADKSGPGLQLISWLPAAKVLTLLLVVCLAGKGYSQDEGISKSVGDLVEAADLTILAVDIVETTSYTFDKLKSCKSELKDMEALLESRSAIKYLSDNDRRQWAKEIRMVSMNIQLYSTILKNVLNRLDQIKTSLGKEDADAIGNLVHSIGSAVGGAMGGGDSNSGTQKVVDAVDRVSGDVKKGTIQETMVAILLKLDEFNQSIDKIVIKTSLLSENLGNQIGLSIFNSMASRSIYKYGERKKLVIK